MSDISDDEDPIDNIDFSVISNSIEAGGNTLDQILNAVHYGSPEIRHLLRESCDFIFECKHCKNLFRSIPNFIAHKRIYCGDKSFFQNTPKKKPKKKEEIVIVRPVSPSLSVPVEIIPKEGEKTVLEQILTGSFQGSSEAYKHYTEAATHVEKQKMIQSSSTVVTSAIKNTQNAVNVNVVEKPLTSGKDVVSNATNILEKAKKSRKQALTKIVDGLKKSATSSNSSPKKIIDKNTAKDGIGVGEVQNKSVATVVKPVLESKRKNNKTQTKADSTVVQGLKEKVDNTLSTVKSGKTEPMKSAKVVLTQLSDKAQISEKRDSAVDKLSQKSNDPSSFADNVKTGKSADKSQTLKISLSPNDLRPVKSQNGSELSELSQLGHCDLDKLKCLICNLQYTQKKTLLQHMHVIHSDTKRKYPCSMCKKKFDYFWGLTRHLLLNHKKSKEEVDRMRPELRGLAYTVNELSKIDDSEHTMDKNQSTMKTARRKQVMKTIVKMNTCEGCHKSFWQKKNYEEHAKQCGFLAADQSQKKVTKKTPTKEEHSQSPLTESVASRRKKTVQKLAESRDTKDSEDDICDNTSEVASDNGGKFVDRRKAASVHRVRVGGKFVSKDFQQKMQEKVEQETDTNRTEMKEKMNENKSNASKNKLVKKLKEKSRTYVPAQRFISTRRSAEFYHSPAQRTRFHDKRRAVVSSPKKDSPSKSRKACEKMSESGSESSTKQSPEQKSELELARRNLLQAIEKGRMKEDDNTTEKTGSPVKKESTATPSNKLGSVKKLSDSETGRSRSVTRRSMSTPSRDGSADGIKKPGVRSDRKQPQSRDSSIDSVRSRKSTRTQRDTSRELSVDSVRSCQSTRSSSRSKMVTEKVIGKRDEKESDTKSGSRLSTRQSTIKDSQDSTNENIANIKSPSDFAVNQSANKSSELLQTKTSEDTLLKLSSLKDAESKPGEKSNRKNVKNSPTQKPDGKKSSPISKNSPKDEKQSRKVAPSKKSPGKDEVDGTKQGGQVQKVKPKWSTKNWTDRKPVDPLETPKSVTKRGTSVNTVKVSKNDGKLKGVTKHKVMKAKARYATRSMKTSIQTAKKIGELKKRYSTRISAKKNDDDSKSQDSVEVGKSKNSDKSKDNISEQRPVGKSQTPPNSDKKCNPKDGEKSIKGKLTEEVKMSPVTDKKMKTVKTSPASSQKGKIEAPEKSDKRKSVGKNQTSTEVKTKTVEAEKISTKSSESKSVKEENVGTSDEAKSSDVTVYSHRPRIASDMEGVKIIEEIWVSKEIGQPLQSVKCKKTIIDSPKKSKAGRMYVVDSADTDSDKSKCLDFSRINHLVDYKNNKCLQCGLELTDISSLRRHAVRHLGWKRYKCRLCAYTGFNRSECNSHIKRRHAEKLIASSSPLSSFIIDLNKEASDVRNRKKKSTMKKKTIAEKKSEKLSDTGPRTLRKSVRKSIAEDGQASESANSKSEKSESSVTESLPASRARSSSGPPVASTSLESESTDNEAILTRKRKRAISEESVVMETKGDDLTLMSTSEASEQSKLQSDSMNKSIDDNLDDLEEELRSVSDYEDNNEPPQRNVVSPTWTKMNANVALMMATLEEARATKFSRGKRGRGGLRKFSPPLRKYTRLSTDDSIDQDANSLKDNNEELSPLDSNVNKNSDSKMEKEKEKMEENAIEESPQNPQSTENNKIDEKPSCEKSEKFQSDSSEIETFSKDEKNTEIKEPPEKESSEENKKTESTANEEVKYTDMEEVDSSVNKDEENDMKGNEQSSEDEKMQIVKSYEQSVKLDVQSEKSDVESVKSDVQSEKSDVESVKSDVQSVKSDVQSVKSDEVDAEKVSSEIVDVAEASTDNKVQEETNTESGEEISKSGEESKQDLKESKIENTAAKVEGCQT
ncbi:uro-adherence factor A-like [Mytilus californianus]|uniref:uro-adherence factor A-like n=1 Tax=Mytilus californianus TaxID=6549 RepID=UPI002245F52E|nr:uro-adherence factor A-like [Mytilus californianus]